VVVIDLTMPASAGALYAELLRTMPGDAVLGAEDERVLSMGWRMWPASDGDSLGPMLGAFLRMRFAGARLAGPGLFTPLATARGHLGRLAGRPVPVGAAVAILSPYRPGNEVLPKWTDTCGGRIDGQVYLTPLQLPASALVVLASAPDGALLALVPRAYQGDDANQTLFPSCTSIAVLLEEAEGTALATGSEARSLYEWLVLQERIRLIGTAVGIIDRSWLLARNALLRGRENRHPLGAEQSLELLIADIDIARSGAELGGLDIALTADRSPADAALEGLVAATRAWISRATVRSAGHARDLVSLLSPEDLPVASLLAERARIIAEALYPEVVEHAAVASSLASEAIRP
jgi:hypothetical protein